MKKGLLSAAAMLLTAGLLAGCGSEEPSLNKMDVDKYVTLGDYSSLDLSIDSQVRQMMAEVYHGSMFAKDGVMNRPVEIGDGVDIDYEGKKDGVAFGGGTAQGAFLAIGSNTFIAGFEDGLVGVMPGETVDLNLTFPVNYGNADLAGQAVVFTVTVNYIVPAVEDMKDSVVAALGIGGIDTVEDLRQYVNDYLLTSVGNDILDAVAAQCTFEELPQTLVEYNKNVYDTSLKQQAAAYGMSAEDFASVYFGMTAEEVTQNYAEMAAKRNLVVQAIANRENLTVSDKELQEMLEEYAAEAGYSSVKDFVGETSREDYRNYFMQRRVLEFLVD